MVFLDNKIGFYTINSAYLKMLHNTDKEVPYDDHYEGKPFVGTIVTLNNYNYFVPLTSAKPKHLLWPNLTKSHCIIFEVVNKKKVKKSWVYKEIQPGKVKHILAALDIKKMIPVPDGQFAKIDFSTIPNSLYKRLLQKEYSFILKLKAKLIKNINETYTFQKSKNIIKKFHCNYAALESACDRYKSASIDSLIENASERSEQNIKRDKEPNKKEYTFI